MDLGCALGKHQAELADSTADEQLAFFTETGWHSAHGLSEVALFKTAASLVKGTSINFLEFLPLLICCFRRLQTDSTIAH